MSQITWRNIGNPNFTGGNEAIESGNKMLSSGINQLAGIGGDLERNQKDSQTASALDQINQLNRSDLATAVQGNDFQNLGNVDQSAINKALRGRGKGIDAENDAQFSRDELVANQTSSKLKRTEQPIMGAIELAMSTGDYGEATKLSEGLSDSSRAVVNTGITKAVTANEIKKTEDAATKADLVNKEQFQVGETKIAASLAQVGNLVNQGVPIEYIRQQFFDEISTESVGGETRTPSETNTLMDIFDKGNANRNKLSETSKVELDGLYQDSDDTLESSINIKERAVNILASANPGGKTLSKEDRITDAANLVKELGEASKDKAFWFFGDDQGGSELRQYAANKIVQGIDPAIVRLATFTLLQSEEEAYGAATAGEDALDKLIEKYVGMDDNNAIRKEIATMRSNIAAERDILGKTKRQARKTIKKDFTKSKINPNLGDIFK